MAKRGQRDIFQNVAEQINSTINVKKKKNKERREAEPIRANKKKGLTTNHIHVSIHTILHTMHTECIHTIEITHEGWALPLHVVDVLNPPKAVK